MPTGRNREDDVLDAIDELVDWQLAGGDQSDTFHGVGFRDNHPCPWCREGYHFLPITERMQAMRAGSYAVDEFGQGIVDPAYDYRTDTSGVVCPGSEFHGPVHKTGMWDKQRRERAEAQSIIAGPGGGYQPVQPSLPPGRLRRLRFVGPFEPWTIALDDDRVIEDVVPGHPDAPFVPDYSRRIPIIVEQRLTATFELETFLKNPSPEWVRDNGHDIADIRYTSEGMLVYMKPIVMPFSEFTVHADNPRAMYPDWVEFTTTYPIEHHPWFMHFWSASGTEDDVVLTPSNPMPTTDASMSDHVCCDSCSPGVYHHMLHEHGQCEDSMRQGHESDIVIIDESYEMSNERLRQHVEEAQSSGSRPPSAQAYEEAQRRQAVLRGGEEAPS